MNLKILSFAALTGMLAATGCGGGSGSGSGIAPTIGGGSSAPSSTARGSITASFDVPKRFVASSSGTSSNARKPQYISPGSSGIEVLINGTILTFTTPTWIVGQKGAPVALVGSPGTIFNGNAVSGLSGFTTGSAVTYSYEPSGTNAGFYTFTLSVQGLASDSYKIAVVLTDLSHKNFVLSEGISATAVSYTVGTVVATTVTLNPVVDTAYLVGPALNPASLSNLTGPTYQFTVYPADELGYVIPASSTANTVFDGQALSVAQFPAVATGSSNVLFAPVASAFSGQSTGSLNPIPSGGGPAGTLAVANASATITPYTTGGGAVTIAAPAGGLPNQGPVYAPGSIYKAGVPVTAEAATVALGGVVPTGSVGVSAYLSSTVANGQVGTVPGYTYVPGTNFPVGALTTAPYAVGTPINLNFTPGLYPVIQ